MNWPEPQHVSNAGDFEDLVAMSLSEDTSVSVAEVTKGQGSWESFTLSWGGIRSQPIRFNATGDEVSRRSEHLPRTSDTVSTFWWLLSGSQPTEPMLGRF